MAGRPGRVLVICALALTACGDRTSGGGEDDWQRFTAGFIESYFQANPLFAVYQGRHEYDGVFPDWTEAGLKRWMGRLHQLRDSAAAFALDSKDSARLLERDYLISVIDRDLFWGERADLPHSNPEFYTGLIDPNVYLAREYAPLPQRMRAFTRYAANLPGALGNVRANLRTPMPKAFAEIGRGRFEGLASYLKNDVPQVFASVRDSVLQRDFRVANAGAAKALADLADWFGAEAKRGTNKYALGPERFGEMLRMTEGVDLSLEVLEQRGREDMNRNLAALKEACGQYAPGQSIGRCVTRVNGHKPAGSPVEAARRQLDTLEAFVRARNLVSIPGSERALVQEAPPYQRFNFAYIDIPGPYEKGLPSIYYIAPPDPAWSEAEQQAYLPGAADLLFTSVHEVWPGHFLNFLHSNRVQSTFGRIFVGYAFAEGWAHYTEEMIWEAGLG
ncbi:MAG TPA: DUF885 family protein, partial [Gemmatimonadales bacterium]